MNVVSSTVVRFKTNATYLHFPTLVPHPQLLIPVDIVRMRNDATPGFPLQPVRFNQQTEMLAVSQCNWISVYVEVPSPVKRRRTSRVVDERCFETSSSVKLCWDTSKTHLPRYVILFLTRKSCRDKLKEE